MEKIELQDKIKSLNDQIKPLQKELNEIYISEQKETEERIRLCNQLKDKFQLDELIFAAHSRCTCGAGLAYPKKTSIHGSWICSAILLGNAEKGSLHDESLSFAFYEVKSENQPSAKGATTRP